MQYMISVNDRIWNNELFKYTTLMYIMYSTVV